MPFGDAVDGDITISADTTQSVSNKSCSGASGQKNLTIAADFSNGDVVRIEQPRGTGVGQWEINRVASGGGSTTLVMQENLHYTYTDSGASQAQIFLVKRYKNVTINVSKTLLAPAWDQNIGGDVILAAKQLTLIGLISAKDKGFLLGDGYTHTPATGYQAEGTANVKNLAQSTAKNGSGGGGGWTGETAASGGSGGHATAGTTGNNHGYGAVGGEGGDPAGSADLINMVFGGGAGGFGACDGTSCGASTNGGGKVILFVKDIVITGGINVGSLNAGSGTHVSGSTGAAGSVLIVCQTATLGSNLITAQPGTPGTAETSGVAGSVGRIAIHHSGIVTGTSSPTFTDVQDNSLVETGGAAILAVL
jgi:hypothetical protein